MLERAGMPDRFFIGDKLKERYNTHEIDAFLRLLAVKPRMNWQDESTAHMKLGVHTYEDQSQELDPAFHTLSEVERHAAEKSQAREWRQGTEVRFNLGEKRPAYPNYRF